VNDFLVDFPTLGDLQDAWLKRHARVPDGFLRGRPFEQSDWQFWCSANHYRIREDAEWVPERPLLNQAFVVPAVADHGPQKTGKGPWSAGVTSLEAVGPVIFGGWAGRGDGYACSEHGCGCGWEYEYEPGEPMGIRHPSPLIQLTAISEDQVATSGGRCCDGPDGPARGSAAASRDVDEDRRHSGRPGARPDRQGHVLGADSVGNPISFALQDESGLATKSNKMVDVYETQRRGAAGMGGRTMETTNAWDPSQNSVAQRTHEAKSRVTCSSSSGSRRRTCRTGTSVSGGRSTRSCTSGPRGWISTRSRLRLRS
jgi:hypothetical protein